MFSYEYFWPSISVVSTERTTSKFTMGAQLHIPLLACIVIKDHILKSCPRDQNCILNLSPIQSSLARGSGPNFSSKMVSFSKALSLSFLLLLFFFLLLPLSFVRLPCIFSIPNFLSNNICLDFYHDFIMFAVRYGRVPSSTKWDVYVYISLLNIKISLPKNLLKVKRRLEQ